MVTDMVKNEYDCKTTKSATKKSSASDSIFLLTFCALNKLNYSIT